MLRAGIIGCGNIARVHARALKSMENVRIQAFADCKPERAYGYKDDYGTEESNCWFSLEEMLEKDQIDVLHICTPHNLHVPMAEMALAHGIHVFMEKPPAICCEDFFRLQKEVERSGRYVGICFQNRYNESVMEAFKELEQGKIGKVIGARAFLTWHRDEKYYKESGWRGKKETEGGGVLINQAIHTLDLLVQFLGKPLETEGSMHNHHLKGKIEVEDTLEAYIRFEKGNACFYATNAYMADMPVLIELECENGRIRIEENQLRIQYRYDTGRTLCFPEFIGAGKAYWGNSHGKCIGDYYDCLLTGKKFRNDMDGVKETFFLAMDLYESAKEEKCVIWKEIR